MKREKIRLAAFDLDDTLLLPGGGLSERARMAIQKAAEQGMLPHFQKALVVIHIATPRGSNNTKVWDTSNRARSSSTTRMRFISLTPNNHPFHVPAFTRSRLKKFPAWEWESRSLFENSKRTLQLKHRKGTLL